MLVTPEEVLLAMGTVKDDRTLAAAKHALSLTLPIVESLVESPLEYTPRTDFFDYRGHTGSRATQPVALRLTAAYVQGDVTVRYSPTGAPLRDRDDGQLMSSDTYMLDRLKGIVHLSYPPVRGAFAYSITYEHGFDEGDEDSVPHGLSSLAVQAAICALNLLPVSPTARNQGKGAAVSETVYRQMRLSATAFYRPRLTVEFPATSLKAE